MLGQRIITRLHSYLFKFFLVTMAETTGCYYYVQSETVTAFAFILELLSFLQRARKPRVNSRLVLEPTSKEGPYAFNVSIKVPRKR